MNSKLTPQQLEHFRGLLQTKSREVENSAQALAEAREDMRSRAWSESAGLTAEDPEAWLFLNGGNLDEMLLREIEEALHSIEDGSYGVCLECEHAIAHERLEEVPWACFCTTCQENLAGSPEETLHAEPVLTAAW
jgi:RNA polymerase-binding protein DksA